MIGAVGVALAGLVVGATGFGFNLLAVPLLALFLPAKEAVVVALVTGFIVNSALAISGWPQVRVRLLGTVLVGSVPGVAIGSLVFVGASDQHLKLIIAIVTAGFAIQLLVSPASRPLGISRTRLVGVGVVSGTLTAISGMGGPPLVTYLTQALPTAREVRATIAAHSAAVSLVALLGILVSGALELRAVTTGLGYVIPGLVGLLVGMRLFSARQHDYHRLVASTLLVVAVVAMSSVIAG